MSLRVPNEDLAALERIMPGADRSARIRHCIRRFLEEHALDYLEATTRALRDELADAERMADRLRKHGIHVDDQMLVRLRRRAEQTKLQGFSPDQQRSWLRAMNVPEPEHEKMILLLEDLQRR